MSSDVNDLSSSWFNFLAWLETNKRHLMWAGIGLLAVAFAAAGYRWNVAQTEETASEALLRLRTVTSTTAPSQTAATATDFLKIVNEYPKTAAAERALLLAAGTQFTDGKFAEAQAEFERFGREDSDSPLAPIAAYGVASSLEALAKNDEAIAAYQRFQTRYSKSAFVDEAKLAVARIYEAKGQPDLALKTYEEIARPGAIGAATSQAMQRKQQLLAAHPELAKTNAPAASGTNASVAINKTSTATNSAPAKP